MKKSEFFSIPNILGYFRIILIPVYLFFFYRSMNGASNIPAVVVIAISGLTDFFDGKIARKFHMITNFGKILDPVADKLTIFAIVVSLAFKYKIVIAVIVLYIIKEGYMAFMGMLQIKRGIEIKGAMWYGKVCTFSTYVIFLILLIFSDIPYMLVVGLVCIEIAIMIFTLISYFFYHAKLFGENRND